MEETELRQKQMFIAAIASTAFLHADFLSSRAKRREKCSGPEEEYVRMANRLYACTELVQGTVSEEQLTRACTTLERALKKFELILESPANGKIAQKAAIVSRIGKGGEITSEDLERMI